MTDRTMEALKEAQLAFWTAISFMVAPSPDAKIQQDAIDTVKAAERKVSAALTPSPPAQEGQSGCQDCGRSYGEPGFPDLIIPFWAWRKITPSEDDGGLLCPSCICARLEVAGIKCQGSFMSGPIESVPQSVMYALRSIENIALAIEGGRLNTAGEGLRKIIQEEMEKGVRT